MNVWMLRHLQQFLQNDFSEYNARPYQNYSAMALQNLYDFAEDSRVKLAAEMVLDYISAKFAVSSNGLRRAAPFRRRKEYKDSTPLFDGNSDPQAARFMVLTGLTQRLGEVQPAVQPSFAQDAGQLVAVGTYRVPYMILDLMMNNSHRTYYQRIRHAGVEVYSSSSQFLITGGGIWMESVHGHDEFNKYADAGWALPTTLMPTAGGVDRAGFIRIDGAREDHNRVNTCVAPGFACGLNPFIPPTYFIASGSINTRSGSSPAPCSRKLGPWTFIDASGRCNSDRRYGFYAAVYSSPCVTPACRIAAGSFGFFEAVPSEGLDFDAFQKGVLMRNGSFNYKSEEVNEYVTVTGRRIRFIPNPLANKYRWGIVSMGDPTFDASDHSDLTKWPLAEGDIINSDGHSGLVIIDNKFLNTKLVLDMRNPLDPHRTLIDNTPVPPFPPLPPCNSPTLFAAVDPVAHHAAWQGIWGDTGKNTDMDRIVVRINELPVGRRFAYRVSTRENERTLTGAWRNVTSSANALFLTTARMWNYQQDKYCCSLSLVTGPVGSAGGYRAPTSVSGRGGSAGPAPAPAAGRRPAATTAWRDIETLVLPNHVTLQLFVGCPTHRLRYVRSAEDGQVLTDVMLQPSQEAPR
jgi:hypothetical protein